MRVYDIHQCSRGKTEVYKEIFYMTSNRITK